MGERNSLKSKSIYNLQTTKAEPEMALPFSFYHDPVFTCFYCLKMIKDQVTKMK
jgi:hypothetical protein